MRRLSDKEHAEALFEFLAARGALSSHVERQEFLDYYETSRIDDESDAERPFGDVISTFTKHFEGFASTGGHVAESTHATQADLINAKSRAQRHQEVLDRWKPSW